MEIQDLRPLADGLEISQLPVAARGEAGIGLRQESRPIRDRLGVPRDPRGIVLACGYAGAAAIGVAALVSTGDAIGLAYLLIAVTGYVFLQTRLLPAFLWLLVCAYTTWSAFSGASVNWIAAVLSFALTGIALLPVPGEPRHQPGSAKSKDYEPKALSTAGNGSAVTPMAFGHETGRVDGWDGPPAVVEWRLRCIGPLVFEVSGCDVATPLEDKPVLSFLFKYLLARWALGDAKVGRTAIGDELTPGVAESSQRERLRKQLYDLQRDVGPELGSLIRSNRSHVWIDLSEVDSDIGDLRRLGEEVRDAGGRLVSQQLIAEIEQFLGRTQGQEFLAGFEELESRVNQGRGTAGQTVSNARLAIAEQRAELIRSLAEFQDALGRPEAAIPYLRSGLDALPSRQDLARLLATAYLKTGQTQRASEVRSQFALTKE